MTQVDIQPFTKKGMKLMAQNPSRTNIRHWSNNEEIGVKVTFLLQTGKSGHGVDRVVLIPPLYAHEKNFQLDIDSVTDKYVLRTKRDKTFDCESPFFSMFAAGGPLFVEQFWNHENVSDSDRRSMREAYLLYRKQEAQVDDEYMELKVATLFSEIKRRKSGSVRYNVMRSVRLLKPHGFYIRDDQKAGRAHKVDTLSADTEIRLMDPSLFLQSFETTGGTKLFATVITAFNAGKTLAKEGFIPLVDLTYTLV